MVELLAGVVEHVRVALHGGDPRHGVEVGEQRRQRREDRARLEVLIAVAPDENIRIRVCREDLRDEGLRRASSAGTGRLRACLLTATDSTWLVRCPTPRLTGGRALP